jgi:hypothetical protein
MPWVRIVLKCSEKGELLLLPSPSFHVVILHFVLLACTESLASHGCCILAALVLL